MFPSLVASTSSSFVPGLSFCWTSTSTGSCQVSLDATFWPLTKTVIWLSHVALSHAAFDPPANSLRKKYLRSGTAPQIHVAAGPLASAARAVLGWPATTAASPLARYGATSGFWVATSSAAGLGVAPERKARAKVHGTIEGLGTRRGMSISRGSIASGRWRHRGGGVQHPF